MLLLTPILRASATPFDRLVHFQRAKLRICRAADGLCEQCPVNSTAPVPAAKAAEDTLFVQLPCMLRRRLLTALLNTPELMIRLPRKPTSTLARVTVPVAFIVILLYSNWVESVSPSRYTLRYHRRNLQTARMPHRETCPTTTTAYLYRLHCRSYAHTLCC